MPRTRTTVYADPQDLAIIKAAARRRGVSQAEIIRHGIHLAALANQVWEERLFSRTFSPPDDRFEPASVRDTAAEAVRDDGPASKAARPVR